MRVMPVVANCFHGGCKKGFSPPKSELDRTLFQAGNDVSVQKKTLRVRVQLTAV
jgi:hypothetical protein